MKIKELNLLNLGHKFNKFINEDTEVPEMFNKEIIHSFNNRIVTPNNVNHIIILMRFLNVESKKISKFIIFNSIPCKEPYNLTEINKGIYLPDFLRFGLFQDPKYLYQICEFNLINWTKFAVYNECVFNEFTLYIALKNGTRCYNYLVNNYNNKGTGMYDEKYFSRNKYLFNC